MIIVGDKKKLTELRRQLRFLEKREASIKLSAGEVMQKLTLERDIGILEARAQREVSHG